MARGRWRRGDITGNGLGQSFLSTSTWTHVQCLRCSNAMMPACRRLPSELAAYVAWGLHMSVSNVVFCGGRTEHHSLRGPGACLTALQLRCCSALHKIVVVVVVVVVRDELLAIEISLVLS